jgi:competence protein ComEA
VAVLLLVLPGLLREEDTPPPVLERFSAAPLRIDVGRAPWYEWALLEGIGEARGRRIVEYRERHGPLRSPGDLARIPGLPSGWVKKAEPHLLFPPAERNGER